MYFIYFYKEEKVKREHSCVSATVLFAIDYDQKIKTGVPFSTIPNNSFMTPGGVLTQP